MARTDRERPGSAGAAITVIAWPAGGANPYNRLLSSHLEALGVRVVDFSASSLFRASRAIWHLHWPERMLNRPNASAAALRAAALLALAFWARLRGTRLVWTVHNLSPHELDHPWVGRWFWPLFVRQLSGFIALSAAGRRLAEARHPALRRIPAFLVPHGHYRGAYPDSMSRAEARSRLGLPEDAPTAAFLGSIRSYKNVPHLIDTFRRMDHPEAYLLVAGEPFDDSVRGAVERAADGDPRIRLVLEFIPDQDVQVFLRAADLVVLPFEEILNSGSALLALSFDRPILVPRIGAIADLEEEMGADWVRGYSGGLTPDLLSTALDQSRQRDPGRCESLNRYDWKPLAWQTREVYRTVRSSGPATRQAEEPAGV